MNLAGKKAIVTGGSGGYGKGIAAAFKQAGAEVWITGRNEQKLQAAAAELGVHAVLADVASGKDWDNVMKQAGSVDILINNAGGGGSIHPLSEQSDEEIISAINNNLTGTLLGCARAAKIMQQKKSGLIVNISSVCALYAWPAWSVYTAAKAGLSKFSHGLYTELRPYGVRVFCVTPSWGATGFNTAANIPAFTPEQSAKAIQPFEMGKLILELAELPDHLNITDITIQPLIQDINPM
ncbi:MAG: SDR family oxidoreductase [Lentisphaeria bacterium]|nr:SDR family oxidoreductase [Lentisphaeria bacterium]